MKIERFSVFFEVEDGSIEIECSPHKAGANPTVGYHFKAFGSSRYYNGPINYISSWTKASLKSHKAVDQVESLLASSQIKVTPELTTQILLAASAMAILGERCSNGKFNNG